MEEQLDEQTLKDEKLIDDTLRIMLPGWIRNMIANENLLSRDIMLYPAFTRPIERYVLLGAGPSLSRYVQRDSDFTVVNQTSFIRRCEAGFRPDVCIITDYSDLIWGRLKEQLRRMKRPRTSFFFASSCDTRLIKHAMEETQVFGFHQPSLPGKDRILDIIYGAFSPKKISTNIVQAGNSMNAAMLIVVHLILQGIFPMKPLHFAGVDFAEENGDMSNPRFLPYARDNEELVKAVKEAGFSITMEKTPGILKQWITEV